MARCLIIAAYQTNKIRECISLRPDDFIICADAGYLAAIAEGLEPNVVLGDFDSLDRSRVACQDIIHVPVEKDDTDTMLCLKHGMELGFREFLLVGGIGGRLDHTIANLQTLLYAALHQVDMEMTDGQNIARVLLPGTYTIPAKRDYKMSLFSMSETCTGITYTGLKYPLADATLVNSFPLGVSNEFVEDRAKVTVKTGHALLVYSRD